MAKKTKAKRKSATWWVSLDKQCRPGCTGYLASEAVEVCVTKPRIIERGCGCTYPRHKGCRDFVVSLAEYRTRFANTPELVPGGPPRKVRLRMEVA